MPNGAEDNQLLPSSVPHSQIVFRQGMGRVRRMKVRTGASEGGQPWGQQADVMPNLNAEAVHESQLTWSELSRERLLVL